MGDINIQLDNIKVKMVDKSSGVFSGENSHSRWSAINKTNQGLGTISGKLNKFEDSHIKLNDLESMDTSLFKSGD